VSDSGLLDLKELLFAGEEIVREDWRKMGDVATPDAGISRGSAAGSALDRVAQVGALVIERASTEGLKRVVDTLLRLYGDADREGAAAGERSVPDDVGARRRREIAVRVYALGALAVYEKNFECVRPLVLQKPDERRVRYWLRDTVTSLARSNQFERNSLIPLVTEYVSDHPVLFRRFRANKDDVVNALCQFDFLQCLVAFAETNSLHEFYPNFGAYHNERTEPVIARLIKDGSVRNAIVPGVDNARLAAVIRSIDRLTGQEFFSFGGWDSGWWTSDVIRQFFDRNPESLDRGP
jgi:hypothetical protein